MLKKNTIYKPQSMKLEIITEKLNIKKFTHCLWELVDDVRFIPRIISLWTQAHNESIFKKLWVYHVKVLLGFQ